MILPEVAAEQGQRSQVDCFPHNGTEFFENVWPYWREPSLGDVSDFYGSQAVVVLVDWKNENKIRTYVGPDEISILSAEEPSIGNTTYVGSNRGLSAPTSARYPCVQNWLDRESLATPLELKTWRMQSDDGVKVQLQTIFFYDEDATGELVQSALA